MTRAIIHIVLYSVILWGCNSNCKEIKAPDKKSSPYVLPFPVGETHKLFQGYCNYSGHRNRLAYDFHYKFGEVITCSRPGRVVETKSDFKDDDNTPGHNNRVIIKHEDGTLAWYAHLKYNSVFVQPGDSINYGDTLGLCGTSGRSGNVPHLHFEVFRQHKYQYSDAIPISYKNLKGKLTRIGLLIRGEDYTALRY